MECSVENHPTINCILCGGLFLYPGPKYPLHLFTCHGVMDDNHRDYLVRASEYLKAHGELPEISATGGDITMPMNGDRNYMNDNHCVDVGESQDDYVGVQRVRLTPMNNRDPRLRRAQSTPRRSWNGEDDKTRDPDFSVGRKGKKSGKVLCVTCGRHYASKDTLRKHQKLVCEGSPYYQPRSRSVASTPNPYSSNEYNNENNNENERRMTFG